jgi:hypothetical protein
MEELGSHWKGCHKVWHVKIFKKSAVKRKVSLKSDKNNGYFNKESMYIMIISPCILFRMNILRTKIVENIKILISDSITFYPVSYAF